MTINMQCACGARVELRGGTYINGGGVRDDKGRVFLVEVRADQWLERHQPCLTVKR